MLSVVLCTEFERATVLYFGGACREGSCFIREGGVVVSCWLQRDLSGLPSYRLYAVLPAKHTQTEVSLCCLCECCGKQSAEDPCESWNFHVQLQIMSSFSLEEPHKFQIKDKWLGKDK